MEVTVLAILTSLLSSITCGIAASIGINVRKFALNIKTQHEALVGSQRAQLKRDIVRTYNEAKQRGYITHMELETINKVAESYYALGGNNYIHTLMKRISDMDVQGEAIPMDEE